MANYKRELNLRRLAWHKKNRSRLEIIALMLEAVKNNSTALSGYSLMKRAGINSAQLKECLQSLTEIGFIETDTKEGRVSYRASEKGLDFLRQYYVLLGMMLSTARVENSIAETCEGSRILAHT